jgi:hypothetical protein
MGRHNRKSFTYCEECGVPLERAVEYLICFKCASDKLNVIDLEVQNQVCIDDFFYSYDDM